MKLAFTFAVVTGILLSGPEARADIRSKAAREAAEYVMKKFGVEVAQEGTVAFTKKLASAALRHGDDAISAVRRVGPKALTLADEAGEQAPKALRLLSRHGDDAALWVLQRPKGLGLLSKYGDDAAEVLIKHKGLAEPVIEKLGGPAVKALGAVGPQGGRRMAMMVEGGEMTAIGRSPELMNVIARHGDGAMNFIWRNKGPLAVGTTLTTFLANPEPFINGTNQLASTVAESTVKPIVQETAKALSSLIWTVLVLILGVSAGSVYLAIKHPHAAAGLGKALMSRAGSGRP